MNWRHLEILYSSCWAYSAAEAEAVAGEAAEPVAPAVDSANSAESTGVRLRSDIAARCSS